MEKVDDYLLRMKLGRLLGECCGIISRAGNHKIRVIPATAEKGSRFSHLLLMVVHAIDGQKDSPVGGRDGG
jgi:hypothetical protein